MLHGCFTEVGSVELHRFKYSVFLIFCHGSFFVCLFV